MQQVMMLTAFKIVLFFLINCFFFYLLVSLLYGSQQETYGKIQLLHFNDVYLIEGLEDGNIGGFARANYVIKNIVNSDSLLFFSGDALFPSPMSSYFDSQQMIDALNTLPITAATVGNHEFDAGVDYTMERLHRTHFPWLCANLINSTTGEPLLPASRIVTMPHGLKVGILGLVSDWSADTFIDRKDVKIVDYVSTAKKIISQLKREGAQLIVAITHMPMQDDLELFHACEDIHIILGGHEHEPFNFTTPDGRILLKSGWNLDRIGVITIQYTVVKNAIDFNSKFSYIILGPEIPLDVETNEMVTTWTTKIHTTLNEPIGVTTTDLHVRTSRNQESNFANFVMDTIIQFGMHLIPEYTGRTEYKWVAFESGGDFRPVTHVPVGTIRRGDIFNIMPFNNQIGIILINGSTLHQILEHSVSEVEQLQGQFLQIGGIRFTYYKSKKPGRVKQIQYSMPNPEGSMLLDDKILVVTTKYIILGGDGYSMLPDCPLVVAPSFNTTLSTVVIEQIKKEKSISPREDGRIKQVT